MRTICSLEVILSRFRAYYLATLSKSICGFDFGGAPIVILRSSSNYSDANQYGTSYKMPAPSHMVSWVT